MITLSPVEHEAESSAAKAELEAEVEAELEAEVVCVRVCVVPLVTYLKLNLLHLKSMHLIEKTLKPM